MGLIVQCRCPFKLANKFLVAYSWVFELIQTFPSLRLWKFTWHVTVIVNEKGSICVWSHASVGVSYHHDSFCLYLFKVHYQVISNVASWGSIVYLVNCVCMYFLVVM